MAPPPVILSTASFFARPIAWTLERAAEAGYEGVEIMVTKDPASQDPVTIRTLADRFGLRVGALHAPFLLVTRTVWGADPIGKIDRSVETAAEADIPVVVVHPPYRWQRAYRRWLVEHQPRLEERTGVAVAVENMFPVRVGRGSLAFHADHGLDELAGLPHVALDTSHAAVAQQDLIEIRRRFGDRLRHVHLSDNAGRGRDSHLPPGDGVLDLESFLADLAGSTYEGAVSLEVDLRSASGRDGAVTELLVSMRERVEGQLETSRAVRPGIR
jgi:sugar phosphate isomerase/epimerase